MDGASEADSANSENWDTVLQSYVNHPVSSVPVNAILESPMLPYETAEHQTEKSET